MRAHTVFEHDQIIIFKYNFKRKIWPMLSLYKLCSVFGLFNDVARSTELTWHEVRNDMMIMNYVG